MRDQQPDRRALVRVSRKQACALLKPFLLDVFGNNEALKDGLAMVIKRGHGAVRIDFLLVPLRFLRPQINMHIVKGNVLFQQTPPRNMCIRTETIAEKGRLVGTLQHIVDFGGLKATAFLAHLLEVVKGRHDRCGAVVDDGATGRGSGGGRFSEARECDVWAVATLAPVGKREGARER